MNQFKTKAVERLLAQHKPEITLSQYQSIQRQVEKGAEGISAYALTEICRMLKCLPTDIMRAV